MEDEGSLDGYVLRSLMGRRHQAGTTCPTQAARPSEAGGNRDTISCCPACRTNNHSDYSSFHYTGSCSGNSASERVELIQSIRMYPLGSGLEGRAGQLAMLQAISQVDHNANGCPNDEPDPGHPGKKTHQAETGQHA